MNLKMLLRFDVLFATTILVTLSVYGFLGDNSCLESAMAQSVTTPTKPFPATRLQAILDEVVNRQGVPGAVMYISTPNGYWSGAAGVRSLESKEPMQPNDGFSIASTSKTFVAVVVLQLVEEGRIILDRQISTYLPKDISDRIPYSHKITVRQLLNHTSGVAEYLSTPAFLEAAKLRDRSQPWKATEAIQYIYDQKPKAPPGEEFSYTDTNYILLQLIIEQTTGMTLTQAVRERILNPLGLKNTYTELWEPPTGPVATGYIEDHDGQLQSQAKVNDGNGLGDGALISDSEDLSNFLRGLLLKKVLLSSQTVREMLAFKNPKINSEYGLGIEHFQTPCGDAFGHTGSAYGFVSIMLYIPSRDTTEVVLVNRQGIDPKAIAFEGLKAVLGQGK